MRTTPNTVYAEITVGERFDGDDSFWICESGCEDIGPFDSHDAADSWFRQHIGPRGHGDRLAINDTCHARKYTNFRDGEQDIGDFASLDAYIEATADVSGLSANVVRAYHDGGYYIAVGEIDG